MIKHGFPDKSSCAAFLFVIPVVIFIMILSAGSFFVTFPRYNQNKYLTELFICNNILILQYISIGEETKMDIDKKVWEILFSEEDILNRVDELGKQISNDYRDKNLYIVSLLG